MTTPTRIRRNQLVMRGANADTYRSTELRLINSGPAGSGKTRVIVEKVATLALKYPNSRILIARATLTALKKTALITLQEQALPELIANGTCRFVGETPRAPAQFSFTNGSSIVVGGLDEPGKIMSSEYDLIFVNEVTDITKKTFDLLFSRLRGSAMPYRQLIADCNPSTPHHWIYKAAQDGSIKVVYSTHRDNPRYFNADGTMTPDGQEYVGQILESLTGADRLRLLEGKWAAAEGLVYQFDPAVHFLDTMPDNSSSWDRIWSVDFGIRNPLVLQCWAIDPDDTMILEWEFYGQGTVVKGCPGGRTYEDTFTLIESGVRTPKSPEARPGKAADWHWHVPKPRAIVADHDADGRMIMYNVFGQRIEPADKSVAEGLDIVRQRFAVNKASGKPAIMFCRDALIERDEYLTEKGLPASTIEELSAYTWPDDSTKDEAAEKPLKANDHGMDAMRYAAMYLEHAYTPKIRYI